MPLFSVIVPVYNIEKYINRCIESILNQSYSDFELILVDDGSPDNCPHICDRYADNDSRIVVIHKSNGGLVSARKSGCLQANGKYVVCIDGDDWISCDYLENFANIIKDYDADVICCGANWAYEDKNIIYPITSENIYYKRKDIEDFIFPELIESKEGQYFPPTLWAKAFKRELYVPIQLSVDDSISIGEDHVCTKPIIYIARSLVLLSCCPYFYRQNSASMTKVYNPLSWKSPIAISKQLEMHIKKQEFDFALQLNRITVHNLFNVCVSRFYQGLPYSDIKREIINNIKIPFYKDAISHCKYKKNLKGNMALMCMRFHFIFPIYLYSRLRQL